MNATIEQQTIDHKTGLLWLDQAEAECKRNDVLAAEAKAKHLKAIPNLFYARIKLENCHNPLAAARVWPLADLICKYCSVTQSNGLQTVIENMRECEVESVREFLRDGILGYLIKDILDKGTAKRKLQKLNEPEAIEAK